jgi:signal transduction histidine kinase
MLETFPRAIAARDTPEFLAGGGEMGDRMRSLAWGRTPLGPPAEWPQALRHAVRLLLASKQPMSLWWGEQLVHLYNDACREILGPNHPSALGMGASVVWADQWSQLAPRAEAALRRQQAAVTAPLRFMVDRHGVPAESFQVLAGHPVPGEHGHCGGVLWSFSDVTASVVRDRQLDALHRMQQSACAAEEARGACRAAVETLVGDGTDVPFAAIYFLDAQRREALLAAGAGIESGHEALPEAFMLSEGDAWPLAEALSARETRSVSLEDPRLGPLPSGAWDRPPREALVVPLSTGEHGAVMIAALNPFGAFNAEYARYIELAASAIGHALERLRCRAIEQQRDAAAARIDVLERTARELREHACRKDEFLATLAHELRNPLAPLRNGLELMRIANADSGAVEKARGMMQRQFEQLVRLVDDLLDVSRVGRGKLELRRKEMDLAQALRTAVEACQPLMAQRGHTFVAAIPAQRIVVDGDPARLTQVFANLLNNAAKYTEPGGRVELALTMRGDQAVVSVKDNGTGIPPEMQERIFDIFTQVDRSLERTQGGLGIGLNIAKRLVELHGGRVTVESAGSGCGTQFTVALPARIAAPAQPPAAHVPGSTAGPGRRVLVADDNPDSCETLQIMLEVMGNEVRVARDGEEAVRVAADFRPDAILLDIGMPKMDGYEACQRIRSMAGEAQPFIIALTGWGQDEDRTRSKAAGFDRHFVKPVEPRTLEGLIRSLAR